MARLVGLGKHPATGSTREIWEGFSWPAFFFGWAWCFYKGLWPAGAIVLSLLMAGGLTHPALGAIVLILSSTILGSFGNEMFANSVLKQGFVPVTDESPPLGPEMSDNRIDRLERLVALKNSGALSEDEFLAEKAKVIE